MAEHLNAETFADFIAGTSLPVLVDFYKDGCIPCRRVAPLLSKAEAAYAGKLRIVKVNLTQNEALAEQYQIEAAPTLVVLKNGAKMDSHRGVITRDELRALIERNLERT